MVVQSPQSVKSSRGRGKKVKKTVENESGKDSVERRSSSRIQAKQRAEKQLLVRRRVELLDEEASRGSKRANVGSRRVIHENGCELPEVSKLSEEKKAKGRPVKGDLGVPNGSHENVSEVSRSREVRKGKGRLVKGDSGKPNGFVTEFRSDDANVPDQKSAHTKVKEALRLFNKYYLQLVQGSSGDGKPPRRPELRALSKMIENNEVLYHDRRIGELPGINVGHQFYSRAEMSAVGLHNHWLNGIAFIGESNKISDYQKEYASYTFPIATAIVLSGMYEDDLDNAEEIVYTGQGGHNLTGDKRQVKSQDMKRGNLALKNCVDQDVPVRVIRGHKCKSSYTGKVYTYDGLYKVIEYWPDEGISGYTVFKYKLKRLANQPTLTTSQVYFVNGRVPKSLSEIRGLVCKDITGGQEQFSIPATNLVDDPPVAPTGYTYSKTMKVARGIKLPVKAIGCDCKGTCVNPRICACAKLNGSYFPYVDSKGCRLIEARDVVFECGPKCGCGPNCINRTSQRGIQYRLEVFRTPKKGWAVRSWDFIPAGAPVCEYIGVLMRSEDLDVSDNNYIFDIDCLQTMRGLGGREKRQRNSSVEVISEICEAGDKKSDNLPEFCIDAGSVGNVARFINHSCEPNLFIQCVLSSHHDIKLARVMLFAADNIPALQELTYDYGYALDSVYDANGKVKKMACFCGAADCRKRLF